MNVRHLTGHRCLCRGCGEFFNSVRAFDRHRAAASSVAQRCLTAEEMVKRGMSVNVSGFWITKPRIKNRVQPAPATITAALKSTPVGYQGGCV